MKGMPMKNDKLTVVSSKIQKLYRDILSKEKLYKLIENGKNETLFQNIVPVASINVCDANGTAFYQCLLTGIYPNNPKFMHGLIYNEGFYQFNVISLSYIQQLAKQRNGSVVPDKEFEGIYNMAVYAKVSAEGGVELIFGKSKQTKACLSVTLKAET